MFAPLAAGLCYFAIRQLPAAWPSFRETRATTKASIKARTSPHPVVGASRHRRHRHRLHRLAASRTHRADHLPPRSRHLLPGRLLDRAPRLPAHSRLGGRVRRPAPGPGLRQLQLLPARHGDRAAVHDRDPARPRRGDLAQRHQRRPADHARDRRVRGALVRRPGRAAGRTGLGAGRRGRAGAEPAAAVHQPWHVQRAAGPGPAVRRPVPAGRLARHQQKHQDRLGGPGQGAGRAGRAHARADDPGPHRRAERHPPGRPVPRRAAGRAPPAGRPVRRGPGHRRRLRPGRRLPQVPSLPGPGGAVAAPPGLHRRGRHRGHGRRPCDHRHPARPRYRQTAPGHENSALPARRGRRAHAADLRRPRRQAARPARGRGDQPDLDRLRGRTPEAGRPPRQRAAPVLRGEPVLGDLVPRRPRRAARRVRPGRAREAVHQSATGRGTTPPRPPASGRCR